MTSGRFAAKPTGAQVGWVLALAVLLPLLAFGNCVTRGSDFGPWHAGYLVQIGFALGCVAIGVWMVRRSRIGAVCFLIYGGLWTVAPELYWRPKDRAFLERVAEQKASDIPNDWVMEARSWPSSSWTIVHSDGEIWTVDG